MAWDATLWDRETSKTTYAQEMQALLMPMNFSCIKDGAWMVNNQNKTSSIILDSKLIAVLNLVLILFYYFYLGCMDSPRMSLW